MVEITHARSKRVGLLPSPGQADVAAPTLRHHPGTERRTYHAGQGKMWKRHTLHDNKPTGPEL